MIDTLIEFFDILKDMILPPLREFSSVLYESLKPLSTIRNYLGGIPSFQEGGYVSNNTLAYLHAGESVIPKGGNQVTVVLNNSITNKSDADYLVDQVIKRLEVETRWWFWMIFEGKISDGTDDGYKNTLTGIALDTETINVGNWGIA